jgi:hypothetical protein
VDHAAASDSSSSSLSYRLALAAAHLPEVADVPPAAGGEATDVPGSGGGDSTGNGTGSSGILSWSRSPPIALVVVVVVVIVIAVVVVLVVIVHGQQCAAVPRRRCWRCGTAA